jgi:hypothetical protein
MSCMCRECLYRKDLRIRRTQINASTPSIPRPYLSTIQRNCTQTKLYPHSQKVLNSCCTLNIYESNPGDLLYEGGIFDGSGLAPNFTFTQESAKVSITAMTRQIKMNVNTCTREGHMWRCQRRLFSAKINESSCLALLQQWLRYFTYLTFTKIQTCVAPWASKYAYLCCCGRRNISGTLVFVRRSAPNVLVLDDADFWLLVLLPLAHPRALASHCRAFDW